MSSPPTILVLHGITMSGSSMLRTLGPLGSRLEELGFALEAPTAPRQLDASELDPLLSWMRGRYAEAGQDVGDSFREGRFWDAGEHYDWFQSSTDAAGKKTYHSLERSLASVADAMRARPIVGVLGFSQGCAMAIVLAALAATGNPPFANLRFGLLLSGFKPVFDAPTPIAYPIGPFSRMLVIGDRDPIFPGNAEYLASLGDAFRGGDEERIVVPGLGHDVPSSPDIVERIAQFARRASV